MDDQDDRGYSRAPELEDLLALCKALNAEGVRYVLIGGFAVILDGFVRSTSRCRMRKSYPPLWSSIGKIPALGFTGCLVLEIARKAGHLPVGTFDKRLSSLDGTERL